MLDNRPVEAIVFDAYGTLLDVSSVEVACADATAEPRPFATLWRAKQLEYTFQRSLMERYVDFWQVTADALDYTAARLDVPLDRPIRERLLEAWLELRPFAEVKEALRRLGGRPLAVLSNGAPASGGSSRRVAGTTSIAFAVKTTSCGSTCPAPGD